MSKFKKGDIVELQSGSPKMTVNELSYSSMAQTEPDYECVWFDEEETFHKEKFSEGALKKITP